MVLKVKSTLKDLMSDARRVTLHISERIVVDEKVKLDRIAVDKNC